MNLTFTEQFLNICEIIGIVAFAISGAMIAIDKDLDVFGVIVLGVTTALGGGIIRDIILGINPPIMFTSVAYAALAAVSALCVFMYSYFNYKYIDGKRTFFDNALNIFDAIGLGVFVVLGINTAISAGFVNNVFLILFVGVLTGIGGGMLRDIMVSDIPFVLRKRIYALACIVGGGVYIFLLERSVNNDIAILIGIFTTILIRMLSRKYKWSLPRVKK